MLDEHSLTPLPSLAVVVRITFKTLQQKQFHIDAEPTETVRSPSLRPLLNACCRLIPSYLQIGDIKQKIATEQGFAVETQKIIFSGKHSATQHGEGSRS